MDEPVAQPLSPFPGILERMGHLIRNVGDLHMLADRNNRQPAKDMDPVAVEALNNALDTLVADSAAAFDLLNRIA